jgi:hypothetical protein
MRLDTITCMHLGMAPHLDGALAVTASEAALPQPITSISLSARAVDFPGDIAVLRRIPYESRADSVKYRRVLAELARERGGRVHLYDAKEVRSVAVNARSCPPELGFLTIDAVPLGRGRRLPASVLFQEQRGSGCPLPTFGKQLSW